MKFVKIIPSNSAEKKKYLAQIDYIHIDFLLVKH